MPAWCNWKTRLTQDQLPYGMKVRDLSQVNMLQWCKWKTRLAKAQMPFGMRVRFSPEADTYKWRNWDTQLPQKQLPLWSKGSKPFLYIIGYQLSWNQSSRLLSGRSLVRIQYVLFRVSNSVVECTSHTRVGVSSSLTLPIFTASSSDGRMHDLGSCGRWFESSLAESFVV